MVAPIVVQALLAGGGAVVSHVATKSNEEKKAEKKVELVAKLANLNPEQQKIIQEESSFLFFLLLVFSINVVDKTQNEIPGFNFSPVYLAIPEIIVVTGIKVKPELVGIKHIRNFENQLSKAFQYVLVYGQVNIVPFFVGSHYRWQF